MGKRKRLGLVYKLDRFYHQQKDTGAKENETFVETFKRLTYKAKDSYFYNKNLFDAVVELMDIHFDKFNKTDIYEREIFIANVFFLELLAYSSNELTSMGNETCKNSRVSEPKKEIDKNLNVIKKFEAMIYEYLDGEVVEKNTYIEDKEELKKHKFEFEDFEIDFYAERAKKKNSIRTLLSLTKELKNDLEQKKFDYFPKSRFYLSDLVPKNKMNAVLLEFAKSQNLKGYTLDIKQFIDAL